MKLLFFSVACYLCGYCSKFLTGIVRLQPFLASARDQFILFKQEMMCFEGIRVFLWRKRKWNSGNACSKSVFSRLPEFFFLFCFDRWFIFPLEHFRASSGHSSSQYHFQSSAKAGNYLRLLWTSHHRLHHRLRCLEISCSQCNVGT